jgi:hypothetical protein
MHKIWLHDALEKYNDMLEMPPNTLASTGQALFMLMGYCLVY